jgi:hypothetical protein
MTPVPFTLVAAPPVSFSPGGRRRLSPSPPRPAASAAVLPLLTDASPSLLPGVFLLLFPLAGPPVYRQEDVTSTAVGVNAPDVSISARGEAARGGNGVAGGLDGEQGSIYRWVRLRLPERGSAVVEAWTAVAGARDVACAWWERGGGEKVGG